MFDFDDLEEIIESASAEVPDEVEELEAGTSLSKDAALVEGDDCQDGCKPSTPRTSTTFFDFDELGETEPEPRSLWKLRSTEDMEKLDDSESEALRSTSSSQEECSEEASEESEEDCVTTRVAANAWREGPQQFRSSGRDEPELISYQYNFPQSQAKLWAEQAKENLHELPAEVQQLRCQCADAGLSVEWCIDAAVLQDLLQQVNSMKGWGVCALIDESVKLGLPNPNYIGRDEILHRICTVLVWQKLPLQLLEFECRRRSCFHYYSAHAKKEHRRNECIRRMILDAFPQSAQHGTTEPGTRAHLRAWTGAAVTRPPTDWEVWKASFEKSSSESSDSDEGNQAWKHLGPRVKKVLRQYNGFSGKVPGEEAESWTDQDLRLYFESNGSIMPRRGTKAEVRPSPKKVPKAKAKEVPKASSSTAPQDSTQGAGFASEESTQARSQIHGGTWKGTASGKQLAAPQRIGPPGRTMMGRPPPKSFMAQRPQVQTFPHGLFTHTVRKASMPGQPRPAAEPLPRRPPPKWPPRGPPGKMHSADQHYDTLGLPAGASLEDARKAYRRLALQYHPDKNVGENDGSKFKEITAAYEAICDCLKS